MHRYIHIIGILLTMVVWNTCNAEAQEIVLRGSTHRYSISLVSANASYTYKWSVTGGTTSIFGNGSTSEPILWNGPPGLYTISMFPSDTKTGCAGNIHYFKVQVLDFFVRWQGVSTTVCSAYGNEDRDFSIVAEFTQTYGLWSFEYQIDDNTPIKVDIKNGTFKVINIAGFINRSNTTLEIHKIRITGITISDGHYFTFDGTESDATSHIYTIMVNPAPPSGKIEFIRDL
jgi:hypothetical protein